MNRKTQRKTKGKPSKNNYLLTKPLYMGDKNVPFSIELIQYDEKNTEIREITLQPSLKDYIDKKKINWFKITGISDSTSIYAICREFELHGFDVKDLLSDQRIVKAVAYNNVDYIMTSVFYNEPNTTSIDDIQIAFILGKNYVISFQEEPFMAFDEIRKNIKENNSYIKRNTVDFLLYILLNAVNVSNTNTLLFLEDQLSDLEDSLIEKNTSSNILQSLHEYRVNYVHIKRSLVSLREEYGNILHNTNKLIRDENLVYFNDFDDRMRTSLSNLASFQESLTSLLDLYYNNSNMKMNEIMKRLTTVSTIFIPLTFMVGVWGMNFKFMPEIEWKYGYLFAWMAFGSVALLTYLWIRKQRWF